MIWADIGIMLAFAGLVYGFIRNFKTEVIARIDRLELRQDDQDNRIFFLATGKTLREAILEEKIRRGKE